MPFEVGLTATITREVGLDDLGPVFGTGDVDLLATPRVIAWCEQATLAAVEPHLEAGETTVGMRVRIDHVYPVAPGRTVSITASLARIEGRRLTFQVEVELAGNQVAVGQVVRVLVDRDRFLERVSAVV